MPSVLRALPLLCLVACADTGEPQPGALDPCLTATAPLLGCPPTQIGDQPFTIEDACQKAVDCGVIYLDRPEDYGDYDACINTLRGDEYTVDRLHFTLHCVEVSTCEDLSPCFTFGGQP